MKKSLVKEIKKKYKQIKFHDFYFKPFLNEPSIKGLLFILLFIIIVFYLPISLFSQYFYIHYFYNNYTYEKGLIISNIFDLLIGVHTGVFSLLFALAILIAGSIYSSNSDEKSRILLHESSIFPILILNITIFLSFPISKFIIDEYLLLIPVLLNAFIVTYSFFNTIRILLDKDRLIKRENCIIINNFKKYTKQLVLERLSKNYKYESFDFKNIVFEYSRISSINNNGLYLKKHGFILDIKLSNLFKILNKINKHLEKNNKIKMKIQNDLQKVEVVNDKEKEEFKKINIVLKKSLYDYVHENNPEVLQISDVSNIDNDFLNDIENKLNNCFLIKEERSPKEKLDSEIKNIEYLFLTSINQNNNFNIKRYSELYKNIIKSFTITLSPIGKYNYKDANQERFSIWGGWTNLDYLFDSISNIIHETILHKDKNVIYQIIILVYNIVTLAMGNGDHLIYQKYIRLFNIFYYESKNIKNNEVKKFLLDKIWFIILEISNIYYPILIDKTRFYKYSENNKDFAFPLLLCFQDLIKDSIDNKDIKYFEKLVNEFENTFYRISHKDKNKITYSEIENDNIIKYLKLNEFDLLYGKINLSKKIILFAISTFIIHLVLDYDFKNFKKYLAIIYKYLPNDLDKIIYIYREMSNIENDQFMDWSYWFMERKSIPKVQKLDFNDKLIFTFLVYILKKINNFEINDKKLLKLATINLYYDLNEDGKIYKLIKDINRSIFTKFLSEIELNKTKKLQIYFDKIKQLYLEQENNRIASSKLSDKKVQKYKQKIITSYKESSGLKYLYIKNNKYYNEIDKNIKDKEKFIRGGYNKIHNKELFIETPKSIHDLTHGHWARGIVDFEDENIIKKIISKCENKKITKEDIIIELNNYMSDNNKNYLIISTFDDFNEITYYIFNSNNFIKEWQINNNDKIIKSYIFKGYYLYNKKEIPFINVNLESSNLKDRIILLEENNIGKFIQLKPISWDDKENIEDIFYIKITDLNEDSKKRKEIINDNPDWLKSEQNKELFLARHVVFELYESFKIEINNDVIGLILSIE